MPVIISNCFSVLDYLSDPSIDALLSLRIPLFLTSILVFQYQAALSRAVSTIDLESQFFTRGNAWCIHCIDRECFSGSLFQDYCSERDKEPTLTRRETPSVSIPSFFHSQTTKWWRACCRQLASPSPTPFTTTSPPATPFSSSTLS